MLSRTIKILNTGKYCYPPGHYGQLLSFNILDNSGATTIAKEICAVESAVITFKDDGLWISRNDAAQRLADGTDSHFVGFTDLYYYFQSLTKQNKARVYPLFPAYDGEKDTIKDNNLVPDTPFITTYSKSQTEVEKYRVTVCTKNKNKLCSISGQPLDTAILLTSANLPVDEHGQVNNHFAGKALPTPIFTGTYVLTTDGELYVLKFNQMVTPDGKIRYHSYITAGKPVAAAGELAVRAGEIAFIDNSSGHYRPDCKHSQLNIKAYLKSKGYTDIKSLNFRCHPYNPLNESYVGLPQSDYNIDIEKTDRIPEDNYDFFYTAKQRNGRLYTGYSESVLMTYNETDQPVTLYDQQEEHGYTFTKLYPTQEHVYGLAQGNFYSLNLESGILSEHSLPHNAVDIDIDETTKPGRIYIVTRNGTIYKGKQSFGYVSWKEIKSGYNQLSRIAASEDMIFTSSDKQVYRYRFGEWQEIPLIDQDFTEITTLLHTNSTLYIAGINHTRQSQVTVCDEVQAEKCRSFPLGLPITDIAVDENGIMYVTAMSKDMTDGGVYKLVVNHEGESTWQTLLSGEPYNSVSIDDSEILVTKDLEIIQSSDEGKSWIPLLNI
ncbi:beta propeller repeat protein [Candidatus Enterovibrio escicola]|uniref:hypothetical protein n=1 Tax=Candidatus Enterovibrio escicola TaxID=1927127 RepID=UPI001237BE0A|nr:hypothetical protein [Candidatus Enterovibrio escacola]